MKIQSFTQPHVVPKLTILLFFSMEHTKRTIKAPWKWFIWRSTFPIDAIFDLRTAAEVKSLIELILTSILVCSSHWAIVQLQKTFNIVHKSYGWLLWCTFLPFSCGHHEHVVEWKKSMWRFFEKLFLVFHKKYNSISISNRMRVSNSAAT